MTPTLNFVKKSLITFELEARDASVTFVIVAGRVKGSLTTLLTSSPFGKLHPISIYVRIAFTTLPTIVVVKVYIKSAQKDVSISVSATALTTLPKSSPVAQIIRSVRGTRIIRSNTETATFTESLNFGTIGPPSPPTTNHYSLRSTHLARVHVSVLLRSFPLSTNSTENLVTRETPSSYPTLLVTTIDTR